MQSITDSFNALRITLESKLSMPALVVVSSANRDDGSANVACNLARSFAESSYRTVLIDTDAMEPCLAKFLGKPTFEAAKDIPQVLNGASNGVISNLSAVSIGSKDVNAFNSAAKMDNLVSGLKEKYDVIVVQTAPIAETPIGMQFGRSADGVLMAVRHGRKPTKDDKRAIAHLDQIGAKFLGVIMTAGANVDTIKPLPMADRAAEPLRTNLIAVSDKKESVGAR